MPITNTSMPHMAHEPEKSGPKLFVQAVLRR